MADCEYGDTSRGCKIRHCADHANLRMCCGTCNYAPPNIASPTNTPTQMPGQINGVDEQCRQIYGPDSYLCRVGAKVNRPSQLRYLVLAWIRIGFRTKFCLTVLRLVFFMLTGFFSEAFLMGTLRYCFVPHFVFYICLPVRHFVEGKICRKVAHCFVLSTFFFTVHF